MSRLNRILIATAALSIAGAPQAEAQVRVRERAPVVVAQQAGSGWLGFLYEVISSRGVGQRPDVIVIQEIVEDSPAERAGLLARDTVVAINDLRVSEELLSSLRYSLAPGDEVRVRVRRDGRERTVTLQAADRPPQYAVAPRGGGFIYEIDPDSIRGRMRVYIDSMRVTLDSLHIPRMRVERTPQGVWMYTDTGRVRLLPPDSVWGRGVFAFPRDSLRTLFEYRFPRDSMRLHFDSAFARVLPDMRALRLHTDSLRVHLDSLRWAAPVREGVWVGSGEGIAVIGSRAIAGAELTELNPELGEYFGAEDGVLVVRVPAGTPAARAGLLAGDVIVEVNGRTVDDVSSLRRQISRTGSGEPIRLQVLRKKQLRTIELKD